MKIGKEKLKSIIEAALMVSGKPLSINELHKLFDEDASPTKKSIKETLDKIGQETAKRGYELKKTSDTYRFQAKKDYAPWVSKLWEEKPPKLSKALMETLAIIAYKQPITRAEIEAIRGVATSTHVVKTLTELAWIKVVAHRDIPGKPAVYGTTIKFLDYFNLSNLDELPELSVLMEQVQSAELTEEMSETLLNHGEEEEFSESTLDEEESADEKEDTLSELIEDTVSIDEESLETL